MSATLAAENAELRQRLAAIERRIATPMPEAERNEIAAAQSRADAVECAFGRKHAAPLGHVPGESALDYRRRLLRNYVQFSPKWRGARTEALGNDVIGAVEETVYADAVAAACDPASYPPGTLHPIRERDESGRMITRYVGDNFTWMQHFMTPSRLGKFVEPPPRAGRRT